MRSQLRFVMHGDDERDFAAHVLSDASVRWIDGSRWKTAIPETFRSLEEVAGCHCLIWSTRDRAVLDARYMPNGDDWYCASEAVTLQFLRSRTLGAVITEGRIALDTSNASESEAAGVERRFKALVRFVKKHYANSVVEWRNPDLAIAPAGPGRSANPSPPDPQVWVGPHARRWLRQEHSRCVKQSITARVEGCLVGDS